MLKRIRAEYARDPLFIKMFLDEARVAANLHHQHIVQVNDIGEANGSYFFAMEYLHGEDVRALLTAAAKARAHVPLGVVVAIGSAAAAGLHYAHERRANDKRPLNIVHCDVSPSNILVGYDGSIKVVDFGIAKAALRSEDARSGHLKGKASYMSPEQCAGGAIDRRSDVFSLGIVLYELATTTRLFKGPSDAMVMDAIRNGRAPLPRVRRPDLPNELSMIIMRALDTDPARRYQTADELRVALDRFAAAAGLNTSAAAVASVLKKMFGERQEPWLDQAAVADAVRGSWTDMPQVGSGSYERPSDLAMGTDRFGPVRAHSTTSPQPVQAPKAMSEPHLVPPPVVVQVPELAVGAPPTARRKKLALGAAVLGASGAAAVALIMAGGGHRAGPAMAAAPAEVVAAAPAAPAPAAVAAAAAPAAAPAPVEAAAPARDAREMTAARPDEGERDPDDRAQRARTEQAPAVVAAASKAQTGGAVARRLVAPPSGARAGASAASAPKAPAVEAVAAPSTPAPAHAATAPAAAASATPAAAVTAPAAAAPAPAPAAAAPAMPAITAAARPAAPAAAAPSIPQLPQGIINRIAWDHSRELAKCDDKESGKGEVTVKFVVAADGKVTKPQITTQVSNPKLAACILRSLQKWRFPAQPATGALGSYTIIF